jgi:hypothetical protein
MFSVEDLSREIADLAAHLDAAAHRLLTCIRQFDEAGGWYEQGAASCAHWLAWRIGLDSATAREKVRVARALGKLPAIDEAMRVGKLSYAKVRAVTRVATPDTEAKLLEVAVVATGAQLERLCRGYRRALGPDEGLAAEERSVRQRDLPGGMVKLEIVLAPDEADLVARSTGRARWRMTRRTLPRKRRSAMMYKTFPRKRQRPAQTGPRARTVWWPWPRIFSLATLRPGMAESALRSWFTWTRIRWRRTALSLPRWMMGHAFPRKRFAVLLATVAWWPWPVTART